MRKRYFERQENPHESKRYPGQPTLLQNSRHADACPFHHPWRLGSIQPPECARLSHRLAEHLLPRRRFCRRQSGKPLRRPGQGDVLRQQLAAFADLRPPVEGVRRRKILPVRPAAGIHPVCHQQIFIPGRRLCHVPLPQDCQWLDAHRGGAQQLCLPARICRPPERPAG